MLKLISVASLTSLLTLLPLAESGASEPSDPPPQATFSQWPNTVDWSPEHYALKVRIDYHAEQLEGQATMTLKNQGDEALADVPVLLYRLMNVTSVKGADGEDLAFKQQVETFEDYARLQVNFIDISLSEPVPPGGTTSVDLSYEGFLLGRSEAYGYVRETIDPAFTMIREDSNAYPCIGYPSRRANGRQHLKLWDYEAWITVPDTLVVANGGELLDRSETGGEATFHYVSRAPSWRMDFAVAPYEYRTQGRNAAFALPEDSASAEVILSAMDWTLALYSEWFGPLKAYDGLTVIEIPEGYGSQTDATAIIERAEAFKDQKQLHELYHELSHKWNVPATDQHPPRIEEGLATFLESLTVDELEGRDYLDPYMERILAYVRRVYTEDPTSAGIPIAELGDRGKEGMSYTVGAVFFRLLYEKVGQDTFNSIFRTLYAERFQTGATVDEMMEYIRAGAGTDVEELLNDWVYGGHYSELITQGLSIQELESLYR